MGLAMKRKHVAMSSRKAGGAAGALAVSLLLAFGLLGGATPHSANAAEQQGSQLKESVSQQIIAAGMEVFTTLASVPANGSSESGWVLTYVYADDATAQVSGVAQTGSGDLVIPETVEYGNKTYTVTSIAGGSKNKHTGVFSTSGVQSIVLPNSVTSLGICAFAGCTELTSIVLPDALTSVDESLFYADTKLSRITTVSNQSSSENIYTAVAAIGANTFFQCEALENITLPAEVQTIGQGGFMKCFSLKRVNFQGETIKNIGRSVFAQCTALESIEIPQLTVLLEGCVFSSCTALKKVTFKTADGYINEGLSGHVGSNEHFLSCSSLARVLWKGKKSAGATNVSTSFLPDGVDSYYTVYFYASKEDAQAAKLSNAVGEFCYKAGTKIVDILAGSVPTEDIYSGASTADAMKALNDTYTADGCSWVLLDYGEYNDESVLNDTYVAYPTALGQFDEDSSIVMPSEHTYTDSDGRNKYYAFNMMLDGSGVADLDSISVKSSTGLTVDTEKYTLEYRQSAHSIKLNTVGVDLDEDAVFTAVSANGDEPASYQWQRTADLYNLSDFNDDGTDASEWTDIEGATAAEYSIPSTTDSRKYRYRVVVTYDDGISIRSYSLRIYSTYDDDAKTTDSSKKGQTRSSSTNTGWAKMEGEPKTTGSYQVRAVALTASDEDVISTSYVSFSVSSYTPEIVSNGGTVGVDTACNAESFAAALALYGDDSIRTAAGQKSSSYSLLVNAGSPLQALVAAGAAGVGKGVVGFVTGDGLDAGRVVNKTNNGDVTVVAVGQEDALTAETIDSIKSTFQNLKTAEGGDRICDRNTGGYSEISAQATISGLAADAYTLISDYGNRFDPAVSRGTSVIVCGSNATYDIMSVAQLAYETGSLVLYCNEDGTLSEDVANALSSYSTIYIAGDETYIEQASELRIKSAAPNANVVRIMDTGSAYQNSLSLPALLASSSGEETTAQEALKARIKTLHIAWASDSDCVVAAATHAAIDGGLLVTLGSEAELKQFTAYLAGLLDGTDGAAVETIDFVGSFTDSEKELLSSIWSDYNGVSSQTTWQTGDLVEEQGSLYKITVGEDGSAYAQWQGLCDGGCRTANIASSVQGIPVTGLVDNPVLGKASGLDTLVFPDGMDLYGNYDSFFEGASALGYIYVANQDQVDALEDFVPKGVTLVIHPQHQLQETAAQEATCLVDGHAQYWTCTICGKVFEDSDAIFRTTLDAMTIPATGAHDMVSYPAKAATATEDGYTAYAQCSKCGFQNPAPIKIPATGNSGSTPGNNSSSSSSGSGGSTTTTITTIVPSSTSASTSSKTGSSSSSGDEGAGSDQADGAAANQALDDEAVTNAASEALDVADTESDFDGIWIEILIGILAFLLLAAGIIAVRRYRRMDKVPLSA